MASIAGFTHIATLAFILLCAYTGNSGCCRIQPAIARSTHIRACRWQKRSNLLRANWRLERVPGKSQIVRGLLALVTRDVYIRVKHGHDPGGWDSA